MFTNNSSEHHCAATVLTTQFLQCGTKHASEKNKKAVLNRIRTLHGLKDYKLGVLMTELCFDKCVSKNPTHTGIEGCMDS